VAERRLFAINKESLFDISSARRFSSAFLHLLQKQQQPLLFGCADLVNAAAVAAAAAGNNRASEK
jgi:hypothetical protein